MLYLKLAISFYLRNVTFAISLYIRIYIVYNSLVITNL